MENRPDYLPLFLQQEKLFQEVSKKRPQQRPDSLSFGSGDGTRTILTMVSPMSQSPLFSTRTGLTPLGEFGQIQSPATTPGGSFKRKSQSNAFPCSEFSNERPKKFKVRRTDKNEDEDDEWGTVTEPNVEWDLCVNEMLSGSTAPTPVSEDMEYDTDPFETFPGPDENEAFPEPYESKAFVGLPGCQIGSGGGLTIKRRRTPGTPMSPMCDMAVTFGFPCFPDVECRVEEKWE